MTGQMRLKCKGKLQSLFHGEIIIYLGESKSSRGTARSLLASISFFTRLRGRKLYPSPVQNKVQKLCTVVYLKGKLGNCQERVGG